MDEDKREKVRSAESVLGYSMFSGLPRVSPEQERERWYSLIDRRSVLDLTEKDKRLLQAMKIAV